MILITEEEQSFAECDYSQWHLFGLRYIYSEITTRWNSFKICMLIVDWLTLNDTQKIIGNSHDMS